MTYIDPNKVDSPRRNWQLIEVLRNEGDGDAALAIGTWDNHDGEGPRRCLGMRWNGSANEEGGVGNPQSRGLPTWFILPDWMNAAVANNDAIPAEKKALLKALLTKSS